MIGALPGAMPPLMGYAASHGSLTPEAWTLFAILFIWQFPHFLAIAWMYREDYARAGIRMLPVVEPDGMSTGRQIILYASTLIPVSLFPVLLGMSGKDLSGRRADSGRMVSLHRRPRGLRSHQRARAARAAGFDHLSAGRFTA